MAGNNYYRERSLPYAPGQKLPYKLSRSKIELFMQCPRCFWLDVRHKITRPSSPPFNINKTIDELFKKEFDVYRAQQQPHPLMAANQIQAIPYQHADLETWRHNFTGITTVHQATNLHLFGAVDDVWVNDAGELMIVDYKATSKDKPVTELGPTGTWHDMYRRQMEIYQWLFKQNGFAVSDTGYFVYATGRKDAEGFFDTLAFETFVFPHHGSSDWVEAVVVRMKQCMDSETIPEVGTAAMGGPCEHCMYAKSRTELTLAAIAERTATRK